MALSWFVEQQQGPASGKRRSITVLDRFGEQDRLVAVEEAGALLGGGDPEIAGGAGQDLLYERRRWRGAIMEFPVGLDDERRCARRQG
jgi:hypothetical protein